MAHPLQDFLANSCIQAAHELEKALLRLPEEKRNWQPAETSRSALNQVAECAVMNDATIHMLHSHEFPDESAHKAHKEQIAHLCSDWPTLQKQLQESAARVAEEIRNVPDDDLKIVIDMPWGPMTQEDVVSYPYWNMTYHMAQINYIASMLGCLD